MSKPDDRSDNAEKIRQNIENTHHNVEMAKEMIAETSDVNTKKALKAKNERREASIPSMEKELKDEIPYAD